MPFLRDLMACQPGFSARLCNSVALGALTCGAFGLIPHAAYAQDAGSSTATTSDATEGDEIVVTGVRAAIQKSLETKRKADSIVDSITAEDIGKFPDANIAEAVQRIPGVAIDRSSGEGRYISINGLGPAFSLTLFNGRQIATTEASRSFSFDTIASNLVSQVNVYKTANAIVPEGGLGGTIDILTARPFDYKGFNATAQLGYAYDGNSKKGFAEGSFVVSDTFADGRLGVLLSFTHQKRHGKTYQASTGGFSRNYFVDPITTAYVDDTNAEAWRAWNIQYGTSDSYRQRDGGTAALQFKATDKLTLTADYLYSRFKVKDVTNTGGAYLWAAQNIPTTIRDSNGVYTQLDIGGTYPDLGSYSFNNTIVYRPTTTQQLGLNAKWEPFEDFTATFDGYWSKAVSANKGRNQSHNLEMLYQPGYLAIFPEDGGVPYFDLKGRDLVANMRDLRARLVSDSGTDTRATSKGFRADFKYKPTEVLSIAYGTRYDIQRKDNTFYATPTAISRMYHGNATRQLIDTNSIAPNILMAGKRFGNPAAPFPVFLIDGEAMRAWMANPINLANRTINPNGAGLNEFIANGRTWNAVRTPASYGVKEKDFSAYIDVHLDFDIGSVPVNIVGGVRYTDTQLRSYGTMRELIALTPEIGSTGLPTGLLFATYSSVAGTPINVENRYDKLLPSINLKIEPWSGVILRASASQTMSRPTLGDLAPALTFGGLSAIRRSATGNNPLLKPFVSTNFDGSAEWYYSRKGAIAVAAFHKDAENFIVRSVANEILPTVQPQYQTFAINRPRNAASAKIKGFTASWTHSLDMGFGLQANYTKVKSSTAVDAGLPTFRVPGVSDTANIVAFYEKHGLSLRAAFNWRSKFLINQGTPGDTEPTFGDEYYQIDARIGYEFPYGITVGVEGVNLTNQKVVTRGRYINEFNTQLEYGRQFRATISKKF